MRELTSVHSDYSLLRDRFSRYFDSIRSVFLLDEDGTTESEPVKVMPIFFF